MATTAQTVINRAIQRSALNNPDLVPTAQMLGYITTYEKAVYATAAKYNPEFFGTQGATATRADNTASWDLTATPGDVFAVTGLQVATIQGAPTLSVGDTINIVSFRWPELEVSPRAYIRGQTIYGYGDELGADATDFVESLTVFYSELPTSVTTTSQSLTLHDEWMDLVIVPLARLLALRDNRAEDVAILDAEYNSLMATFIDHCSVYDHSAVRPLIAVPAATAPRPPAGGGIQPGAPRILG
jgi:hypothetical protein